MWDKILRGMLLFSTHSFFAATVCRCFTPLHFAILMILLPKFRILFWFCYIFKTLYSRGSPKPNLVFWCKDLWDKILRGGLVFFTHSFFAATICGCFTPLHFAIWMMLPPKFRIIFWFCYIFSWFSITRFGPNHWICHQILSKIHDFDQFSGSDCSVTTGS